MDVSCNCTWVGAWNRKSKGGLEVRFALFRGSCFVFYGERWRSETMKTERKPRKTLESAFFHVVCGCGGLEETRQRRGVKVWGEWGGGLACMLSDLRVCGGSSFERLSTDLLVPLHISTPDQRHPQTYVQPPQHCHLRHFCMFQNHTQKETRDFSETDHLLRYQLNNKRNSSKLLMC